MADPGPPDDPRLAADSVDELLAAWLNEPLFWFTAGHFAPAAYRFESIGPRRLRAWIGGEPFDAARHAQGTEVKGVTYHQLRVERVGDAWQAEVIVDV